LSRLIDVHIDDDHTTGVVRNLISNKGKKLPDSFWDADISAGGSFGAVGHSDAEVTVRLVL